MPNQLRIAVTWITLAPVVLVGGLGTGLHSLLGCQHGSLSCGEQPCCAEIEHHTAGNHACGFCQRQAPASQQTTQNSRSVVVALDDVACCDGCAVCDLLLQYHSASPAPDALPAFELSTSEASVQFQNAIVSAATRLAFSRGPPTV